MERQSTEEPQKHMTTSDENVRRGLHILTYGCSLYHFPNDPCSYDLVHMVRMYLHSFDPTKLLVINDHKLSLGEQVVNLMNLKRVSSLTHLEPTVHKEKVFLIRLIFEDASVFSFGIRSAKNFEVIYGFFTRYCETLKLHPARL